MAKQNRRRISDITFCINSDLDVLDSNRSFLQLFDTTTPNISLCSYIDAVEEKSFRYFLQTLTESNSNSRYFVLHLRPPKSTAVVKCLLYVTKCDNAFDVAMQELSYAQEMMDKTILENREYRVLLSKLDLFFFLYDGKNFVLRNAKDQITQFEGSREVFAKLFTEFFKIQPASVESCNCLEALFSDVCAAVADKSYKLLVEDGSFLSVSTALSKARNAYTVMGLITKSGSFVSTQNDYSEKKDGLTDLYNKQTMTKLVMERVDNAKQSGALLIIDVDKFKEFNDTQGHAFGDKVLVTIASIIKEAVSGHGIAGRIGGDEFMCFVDTVDEDTIHNIAHNIKLGVQWSMQATSPDTVVTCSIGIASTAQHCSCYEELFQVADKCLYIAKSRGRNCYIIYKPEEHDNLVVTASLDSRNTAAGRFYMDSALSEMAVLDTLRQKKPDYLDRVFQMLVEYLEVHRISLYTCTDGVFSLTKCFGKHDRTDTRGRYLADSDYFSFFNAYDFLHLDNIATFNTLSKDKFAMYHDSGIASTLEVLCKDECGKAKALVCFDVFKPARTFASAKIVFALIASRLLTDD